MSTVRSETGRGEILKIARAGSEACWDIKQRSELAVRVYESGGFAGR